MVFSNNIRLKKLQFTNLFVLKSAVNRALDAHMAFVLQKTTGAFQVDPRPPREKEARGGGGGVGGVPICRNIRIAVLLGEASAKVFKHN